MVKVFIIIGLLLVISGVPGLYWCNLENEQIKQRIGFCKSKYNHQIDEYVRNLTGSSLNGADIDSFDATAALNMEKMKPTQRLAYQQERLLAEIDELAESTKPVPENADLLYGSGWRQKVTDYKTKKQFLAKVQVASITAAIAGGVLLAAAIIFSIVRIAFAIIRWMIGKNSGRSRNQVIDRTEMVQEIKAAPPASTVSNVPAQTVKTNNTAEEFRKLLFAQTESLKETVDQLRQLATVLQQKTPENDHGVSKRIEKGFKSHTESLKQENDVLKEHIEHIRKAVETQANDLPKIIENSALTYVKAVKNEISKSLDAAATIQKETLESQNSDLKNIKQQIDELAKIVHTSAASQKTGAADICEKVEQVIGSKTQKLKERIESLNEIPGLINNKIEEIKHHTSAENSEAFSQYVDGLGEIKRQIAELTNAMHSSASQKPDAADICEKIGELINSQSRNLKKEFEPLNVIGDSIIKKIEVIKNDASQANSEAFSQCVDGLSEIKQQITGLAGTVQSSASQNSGAPDISEKIESLFSSHHENIIREIEQLRRAADILAQKLEEIKSGRSEPNDQLPRQSQEVSQNADSINKNLTDLTEQISAIREYAARQQQHLAKLQDGYDWNLIKNFCLRVIRCIDNLDDRINQLTESGDNSAHLLTIREELAFILESNGVEPFTAKIDSDYRGQENCLQVINERDETEDGDLVGKIARVVRPGYQCRINDEYTKIVRPAHVRLYGSNCLTNMAVRGE